MSTEQGSLYVIAVVAPADDIAAVASAYGMQSARHVKKHAVHSRWEQFERFPIAWELLLKAEASRGRTFDWVVRTRPDLFFYGPLPPLNSLATDAVHSRMRCSLFAETRSSFTITMIPSESQMGLWRSCTPRNASSGKLIHQCQCGQLQCELTSFVMDDQFALIPRALAGLFLDFNATSRSTRAAVTRLGLCPRAWPLEACGQTARLLVHGVRALPTPLPFTIARWADNKSSDGRVYLEGTQLKLDAPVNKKTARLPKAMANAGQSRRL